GVRCATDVSGAAAPRAPPRWRVRPLPDAARGHPCRRERLASIKSSAPQELQAPQPQDRIPRCEASGELVRKERLELSRVSPLDSKSSASASSATFARAVRTGRAGCGHTCRPCVGVARIIADGNLPPARWRGPRSRRFSPCNRLIIIAVRNYSPSFGLLHKPKRRPRGPAFVIGRSPVKLK